MSNVVLCGKADAHCIAPELTLSLNIWCKPQLSLRFLTTKGLKINTQTHAGSDDTSFTINPKLVILNDLSGVIRWLQQQWMWHEMRVKQSPPRENQIITTEPDKPVSK